ncbi:hypothetical protein U0070_004593 [Myodes glareolus]|uniref:Uncharacterized protein n=1 Tax=Myodes glareolus TaxID=447135 RepID=A0AAW0ID23_MYOGA
MEVQEGWGKHRKSACGMFPGRTGLVSQVQALDRRERISSAELRSHQNLKASLSDTLLRDAGHPESPWATRTAPRTTRLRITFVTSSKDEGKVC